MDHQTHLGLAYKLLEACDCDKAAAVYSLLPAIDREPAHYHRVYGHILRNHPRILDVALEVLGGADYSVDKFSYEYKRIVEDGEYFNKLTTGAAEIIGDRSMLTPSQDKVSGAVALVSHIYFDTYNNPVQAFLPESTYCSGQWDFWANIDYLKFRSEFYLDKIIIPFRRRMLDEPAWEDELDPMLFKRDVREELIAAGQMNTKLNPFALIKAMIIRLGELGKPDIEYSVVDWSIRDFLYCIGCNTYLRVDKELIFLRRLESRIIQLIMELIK